MKSLLKLLLVAPLFFLSACKKDSAGSTNLSVTGFSAGVFATGDAVSIYGTGFDPNPANDVVLFDGVAGEVATASANRLQVIVPLLINDGKITVQTHGQTAVSKDTYSIVNVLQGSYSQNFIMTPDKKYLLRGNVTFTGKLIIQAGTVIYGEKLSHGSLTASNIDFEGTAANPIVFTSDQLPGNRAPGDWTGITVTSSEQNGYSAVPDPLGTLEYVRVEYAGYHTAAVRGSAFNIVTDPQSTFKYLQVSYSAGDGFAISGGGTGINVYLEHLVALGCWGDDFHIGGAEIIIQYALGLKDPYNADPTIGNGVGVNSTCVLSNFTLIGYNPSTRNIPGVTSAQTANAGAGVAIGFTNTVANAEGNSQIGFESGFNVSMYNSVIVGGWQAGVSLNGVQNLQYGIGDNWDAYEDSIIYNGQVTDNTLRHNFIVSTAPANYPFRGGVFTRDNFVTLLSGFDNVDTTHQIDFFGQLNDTTRVLDFNAGRDDLGIKGLADYTQLNHPSVLPAANSPLLTAAVFTGLEYDNIPLVNKDITYAGAFGTVDWTAPWCNYNPQQTQY